MDKFLSELPKFFNISVSNFCSIISNSTSSSFSQRTFQAIKSGSSDMLHAKHIKEILKKFSLIDLEEDLNDYKLAAYLADFFAKLHKSIKVDKVSILDLVIKDPVCWISIYEEDNPELKDTISKFKSLLLMFLNAKNGCEMSVRPSFRYTLFLYHLVCVSLDIFDIDINATYIRTTLKKNDLYATLLRRIISRIFGYSNEDIDKLSNKALAKISEKIESGLKLSTFTSHIGKEYAKLGYTTSEDSILNDANEFQCKDQNFLNLDNYTNIVNDEDTMSADKLDQINELIKKLYESLNIESSTNTLEDLWIYQDNNPLNTLHMCCLSICNEKIKADLRLATDKFDMFSLLSKYGIDTSTIKDELKEYGPDYIVKHYYTCHKGYLWWKLYFDRAYNRYFFPSNLIDDTIECKMLE